MHAPRIHAVAAHEAAHVVVGCAVGLRLDLASIGRRFDKALACDIEGGAWFRGTPSRHREAWALMYAAGVVWDRGLRTPGYSHSIDATEARKLCASRTSYLAMLRATAALLAALRPAHERVTRALLERDLTGGDIAAFARGETLDPGS